MLQLHHPNVWMWMCKQALENTARTLPVLAAMVDSGTLRMTGIVTQLFNSWIPYLLIRSCPTSPLSSAQLVLAAPFRRPSLTPVRLPLLLADPCCSTFLFRHCRLLLLRLESSGLLLFSFSTAVEAGRYYRWVCSASHSNIGSTTCLRQLMVLTRLLVLPLGWTAGLDS